MIAYLRKDIEIVEFSRLFLDAKRIPIGRLGYILSSCIFVEYFGSLQCQR
jgi:hypothetical protein